jgi:hypothetical protein
VKLAGFAPGALYLIAVKGTGSSGSRQYFTGADNPEQDQCLNRCHVTTNHPLQRLGRTRRLVQSNLKENIMRNITLAVLAVAATVLSTPSLAAKPQHEQSFCVTDVPCAAMTDQTYNDCTNLAVERGWNLGASRSQGLNWFIYECLTGKIPR